MEDSLITNLEEAKKKSFAEEPSFKEANITFFAVMFLSISTIPLMLLLNGLWTIAVYIIIAALSFVAIIPFFVAGYKLSKYKRGFKVFYYLDFLMSAVSVMMSVLAVLKHFNLKIEMQNILLLSFGFLFIAVLQFVIISAGKRERLLFSLTGLFFIAFIIWGILLLVKDNFSTGLPMLMYSSSFFFIWLSMMIYIASGDSFFPAISSTYFIVALIALVVALAVTGGDCSCDGVACDCAPSFGDGGRRARAQKLSEKFFNQ